MRQKRLRQAGRASNAEPRAVDAGEIAAQVGRFEVATGMPHAPVAILIAALAALLVIPLRAAIGAAVRAARRARS
jgi:hypothetical protein